MIYLVCFFSSAMSFYISEKLSKHNKKSILLSYENIQINRKKIFYCLGQNSKRRFRAISIVFAFLGLLIPSILAGVRDFSIGTDINVYGNIWFERAHNISLYQYLKWASVSSIGIVYALLNYIVGLFTEDAHVFISC